MTKLRSIEIVIYTKTSIKAIYKPIGRLRKCELLIIKEWCAMPYKEPRSAKLIFTLCQNIVTVKKQEVGGIDTDKLYKGFSVQNC